MSAPSELDLVRAELAVLRDELAELREAHTDAAWPEPVQHSSPAIEIDTAVTRRNWMKVAAAAAVGGTALALGTSQPAAAASDMQIGSTTNADASRTVADHTGVAGAGVSFLFKTLTGFSGAAATYPAAVGAWTGSSNRPTGVYGFTSVNTGPAYGVAGLAASPQGAGVMGESQASAGTGVVGRGGPSGAGVRGSAKIGVDGAGTTYGVQATGTEAAVYMPPSNTVAPADRAVTQSPGALDTHTSDLILGSSHLWFCVDGGVTGGTWRKLAGPDSAGSFHAIEPFRAYDSRRATPAPGALASGSSRVVSIKDSRSEATGDLVTADVVPNRATAVTYNITAADTGGGGFFAVAPGDAVSTNASSVNWTAAGVNIANAGVVKLDGNRQITVFCGGGGGGNTHFIIDITGYYL